ncbi:hypothetical protein BFU36_07335 [Sulfolobus sp. A20]|uniref:helix-turn-helix domain-containing protein n=1 Tax=Saccharolobus sp. A20 TaxID=1891280 RepID=UPI000845D220|nr:helix-turn-helix domain-containing protein [Sulfolobus sp. A20]AOL16541.1 hypothetical protein BFU36_07335 [Sulfolobus sp. A20]TRM75046.1 hypothetical protein DJ523_03590 [Sulfolobus sp. E5]TRM77003.1 hypothetical protein DJ528_07525 [Sulfolobus sp. B5]TRM80261.1 hypothetical protein DJ524_08205 [Sulfolobus sp. D5]
MIARLNVALEHYGDWSLLTRSFDVIVTSRYFYPYKEKGYSLEVIRVEGKKDEIRDFIKKLNKSSNIKKVINIIKINNIQYDIIFLGDYEEMVKYVFLERNGILRKSVVKDGLKIFDVYFIRYNKTQVENIYDILRDKGRILRFNINKNDKNKLKTLSENDYLTPNEKLLLEFAYKNGFFDTPRKIDLDHIAKNFKLSKTTANFHIRNGIKKILKNAFSDDDII